MTLTIHKYIEGTNNEPLSGVEFKVTDGSGKEIGPSNGIYYTDRSGDIVLEGLEPGTTVIARETKTVDGYVLDGTPQKIEIEAGKAQSMTFWNRKAGGLVIRKLDKTTHKPLSGAEFELTYAEGGYVDNVNGHLSSNGRYTTDDKGEIRISGVTGAIVVKETRAAEGYVIDLSTQTQTVTVNPQETQTLTFYNEPLCTLTLTKLDSVTGEPVRGAEFTVKDSGGSVFGRCTTGMDGTATMSGLNPGTAYVVTETKAPSGYVLNSKPQTITVKSGTGNALTFENDPATTLTIQKYAAGTNNEPLAGVEFLVTDSSGKVIGENNGRYTTNRDGQIVIKDLKPGQTVTAKETATVEGYILDAEPQSIEIKAGKAQTLTFRNEKAGTLVIRKLDKFTNKPLTGAEFELTYAEGGYVDNANGLLSSKGRYTTDDKGEIRVSGIVGTIVVKELKAVDGYVIDPETQTQTIVVNPAETQTLKFYNAPLCTLTLTKLDSVTGEPVRGAEFAVKDSRGELFGSCTTGMDGTARISGLNPGTAYAVTETKAPKGYVLNSKPQTVTVKSGVDNALTFENDPATTLVIQKYVAGTNNEPLAGVEFLVTDISGKVIGANNGRYTTNRDGQIVIDGLKPGQTVTAKETATVEGYILDAEPQSIEIKAGEAQTLTFRNEKAGTLVIRKLDKLTGKPLTGAEFELTYAGGGYVDNANGLLSSKGRYTTDDKGEIRVSGIVGTIVAKEIKAIDGYVIDPATQTQTVVVNPAETQTLTFLNEPLCSLTLTKRDSVQGKPVPDTEFTVKDSNGNVVGIYTTGKDGTAIVTGLIPGATYVVAETRVPSGYMLNTAPKTITVKNGGGNSLVSSGNGLTFENDPKMTLTIHKYIEGTDNKPLSGVTFKLTDGSGAPVGPSDGEYYTNDAGEIVVEGLEPGTTVTAREIKTVDGFVLDGTPKTVKITADDKAPELTFWNQKAGELVIRKLDKTTHKPLSGAEFELTYAEGGYVDNVNGHLSSNGRYTTDDKGEIRISGVTGAIVVKETRAADGYVIDLSTQTQTVTVKPQETQTLTFLNEPLCSLTLTKLDSVTGKPLANAEFAVKDSRGNLFGRCTTGKDGTATMSGLNPGTAYAVTETKAPAGYVLTAKPQTVTVKSGADNALTFENDPTTTLTIRKYVAGTNNEPLAGVEFLVTDSSGKVIGANNGRYTTVQDGQIVIEGLEPGMTVTAKETRTAEGYVLDAEPQSIEIKAGEAQSLTFWNRKTGTLLIQKFVEGTNNEPLTGVEFLVTDGSGKAVGANNGRYITDKDGRIMIEGLEPGMTVTAKETRTAEGYVLNAEPQSIEIKAGEAQTMTFWNKKAGELVIRKLDKTTHKPLSGAEFELTYAEGGYVDNANGHLSSNGRYTTDDKGEIRISGVTGAIVVKETRAADGYVIDLSTQTQTVTVKPRETQTLTFLNEQLCTLTLTKLDSVTGKPVSGAEFTVKDSQGTLFGSCTTGKDGTAAMSGLNPGTAYAVTETKAPAGYVLNSKPQTVTVKSGTGNALTFENDPTTTLTIQKYIEGTNNEPLSGVEFLVTDISGKVIGANNGRYTTDKDGRIVIEGLEPGATITAKETKTVEGYVLDAGPQSIQIKAGEAQSMTFWNKKAGTLVIRKLDKLTNKPLAGVEFELTYAKGGYVDNANGHLSSKGRYTTDDKGEIRVSGIVGTIVVKEVKALPGYTIDPAMQTQTVTVDPEDTQTLNFYNVPGTTLTVQKYETGTTKPLAGVTFLITTSDGSVVGPNGGKYVTDADGRIVLEGIVPGVTVTAKETDTVPGYKLNGEPQSIQIKEGGAQSLTFYNEPLCNLTIRKTDSRNGDPLSGAQFLVTDKAGAPVGASDGHFTTGANGLVTIEGLEPGAAITVREEKAPSGYALNKEPQTIVLKSGEDNTLTFENDAKTTLVIQKFVEGTNNEPLSGVEFLVTDSSGAVIGSNNGRYTTSKDGQIVIEDMEPGVTVIAKETKTVEGYVRNAEPQSIKIKSGEAQTLTFWNKRAGTLVIQKTDKVSGAPLSGVEFELTYAEGGYVDDANGHISSKGRYTTDDKGEIRLSGIVGTIIVKEVKAIDGYVIDPAMQTQTITVNPADTQTVKFYNEPLCSLTLTKRDSVTGKPVPDTEFTVKDANGNVLGRYTTGKDGTVVVTGLTPNSTVVVSESRVPDGYMLNTTPQTITVRNGANTLNSAVAGTTGSGAGSAGGSAGTAGSGNGLTFENDPKMTLTIHKYIDGTQNEPLAGVTFKLTDGSGAPVGSGDGEYYTNAAGEIVVEGLEPGTTVTAREIKTVDGFVLDGSPKTVKIAAGSKAPELTFWNKRAGGLVIRKLDKLTGEPLAGVEFELTYAGGGYVDDANGHLSSKGLYTTDAKGEIRVSGITGTIVVKKTKTLPGYTIDPGTQSQTVTVNPADTQTLTFYNTPGTTLTIQKFVDGTTVPIQGVTFLVTDSSGAVLGPNNGEYVTDKNGRIVINDLTPGETITARETGTAEGYVLDETPQSILIKEGEGQSLTFYNKAVGGLELIKVSASDKTRRIPDTTFEIRRKDGALVDTVTTGKNGRVFVNLDAGDYYAVEIEAADGFKLDSTPQYFTVEDGKATTLTVTNKAFSGILIHKTNSATGKGIQGVTFLLYDSTNKPIGQYTSDDSGYVYIDDLTVTGRYYLRELENEGYVPDTEMKTVYVTAGETTLVEWKNIPITAQIQILKKSADYNSTNGLAAGTLLEGAVFEIYDKANNLVDTIKSDQRGLAASKPLPLGRYTVKEVKAPANYGVSDTVLNAYLEHEGQIVCFEVTDKSLSTGVSITKTGPKETMAGQPVRYQFSGIANRSNVRLDSFYWRDTLPAQVRLEQVVTGTYNFPGSYKITYRVNGGEPRTLADNLSTSQNYTLVASPVALGLAANERVTEVMFVFGQAPAGFAQVETPMIYCTSLGNLKGGTSFVNVADVGGNCDGVWVQGVSRWVTSVYGKSTPLPKTGY